MPGCNITILEELDRLGGSLDGAGSPETGYVLRGGRMLESKYLCTFGLFSSIPTMDGSRTVHPGDLRLERDRCGRRRSRGSSATGAAPPLPPSVSRRGHILSIELLAIEPESLIGRGRISERFEPSFFRTDFWFMWCTTFAFQPWHSAVEFKRYLVRFAHMVDGFNRLEGIMRTVYNQYDSMVRPLVAWLAERGVVFRLDTRVNDIAFREGAGGASVERIGYADRHGAGEIPSPRAISSWSRSDP